MNNKKSMKAIVLSFGLAVMLLPMTGKAQSYKDGTAESHNSGAFYELIAYDTYLDELANALRISEYSNRGGTSITGGSITNDDFGTSPLGSGLGILLAAGAGYAVVRRKRSRRNTTLLLACLVLLGFTQCKKEQIEPQGGQVKITLNVENGASTGSATDGSKVNVNPNSSPMVTFGNGDRILVAYDGKYVGYLEHNGSNFSGTISASGDNTKPLYFYFLGNCVDVSGLTAGTTTSCTANISDQTGYPALPVISFSESNRNYDGAGAYSASLHNKCSLMKFKVTTSSNQPICITGMNNKVIINFSEAANDGANNGFTYDKDGDGIIKLKGYSGAPAQKWAIVLPQPALSAGADGTAYTNEENQRYKGNRPALDAISSNQFLDSGVSLDVNTADNSTTVDLSKLVYHYRAKDGEILTGTLASNYKISVASGAEVTLSDVTINGVNSSSYTWAGLSCLGGATIVLADGTINTVRGFYENYPGIHIPEGNTLTIQGTGTLDVSNNGDGAGIGGGWVDNCGNILIKNGIINATGSRMAAGIGSGFANSCGFIEIQGGTITATGGTDAAGIGTGGGVDGSSGIGSPGDEWYDPGEPAEPSSCGAIIISGGTVVATGGNHGAGIGTGFVGNCGNISITSGVTSVTATRGGSAQHSIGTGHNGWNFSQNSYTVTIGGNTGAITTSPYTYQP